MQEIKKFLKVLKSMKEVIMINKIFKAANLSEEELKLMKMCFISEEYKEKTCNELAIGKTKYNEIKNQALLKIKIMLNGLLDEKIAQISK